MPLYKLFCIAAHYPEYMYIKDLVMSSAKLLLDNGSAVREIRYLGLRNLPQRMRRHKNYHQHGDYWSMHFDAAPTLVAQLNERMRTDHRVIRWTTLKLGEHLKDVVSIQQYTIAPAAVPDRENGTWSTPGGASLPGMIGISSVLPGIGTDGKVASLENSDEIASLGSAMYARQRV